MVEHVGSAYLALAGREERVSAVISSRGTACADHSSADASIDAMLPARCGARILEPDDHLNKLLA